MTLRPHAAYSLLAPHYERLFGSYSRDLNRWVAGWVRGLEPRPASALDLACGSGATALALARILPEVHALDLEPQLVRATTARARKAGRRVTGHVADMRRFRLDRPVGLVTCFFDAINHLPRRRDLAPTFRAVYRALVPGGTFLFDVNTPHALRRVWPELRAIWKGPGWFAVAKGRFEPAAAVAGRAAPVTAGRGTFEITWFKRHRRDLFEPRLERFREVAWTDREIRAALSAAGFVRIRRRRDPELARFCGDGGRARSFYTAVRPAVRRTESPGRPHRSPGRRGSAGAARS